MSHRAAGDGSISQRKDGRWQAALQVEGVRRIVYGRTENEARKKLRDLQREASSHGLVDPGKRTVADLMSAWLEVSAPNWRPRTLAGYQETCRLHILPRLGAVRLSHLMPARIQVIYANLQTQGKVRTALKAHVTLNVACKMGVRWGWLSRNPCDHVLRPNYHAPRKAIWTADELRRFLDGAKRQPFYPLWMLAVTTGARFGELRGLTWDDVDWQAGTLSIQCNLQRIDGEWVTQPPKTASGERTIGLPPEGVAALKEQRARQNETRLRAGDKWERGNLVFANLEGHPLHWTVVYRALDGVCKRLDLPPIGMHGLRHLHASLLLDAGVPVPAVSQRLGHATPGVTMSIYAHVIKRQGEDQATEAIGRALRIRRG